MVAISANVEYNELLWCTQTSGACGVKKQSTASADNPGAELCGEILDVVWKETGYNIAAVMHLLQKVLVFGQQSEYASCNTCPF